MSNDTPATTTYIRNPAVAATEIDAETFLVEPEEGEVFYLDEISSALWRFLTRWYSHAMWKNPSSLCAGKKPGAIRFRSPYGSFSTPGRILPGS